MTDFDATSMFIGQATLHWLQLMQVDASLLILKILILLESPNSAPYGHAYLHQGRSTNSDATAVMPKMMSPFIETSSDQNENKAL